VPHRRLAVLPLAAISALAATAARAGTPTPLVAEQVTVGNAATHLFGGTDADGGVDDWYLSNGIVEAIVDDVGVQADVPPGVTPPPKQNEAAFTGCSLLDLALEGANNDQLVQLFTVGGLSTENFIVYGAISASVSAERASVTCTGQLLGFGPVLPSELPVVTTFSLAPGDPFLTIETVVANQGSETAGGLGGFLDVFLWIGRAQVPFSPLPDRGFSHHVLDFANPFPALEQPAFAAAPGVIRPEDGVQDTVTGLPAGEVAYGLLGVEASLDPDAGGPMPPVAGSGPVNNLFGVSNADITALGNPLLSIGGLEPGGVLEYERRIYVGARNDVASVASPILAELAARHGFGTGTISGDVDAADGADVTASVVATRTGGAAVPGFAAGAPLTHFRTDATGAFSGVVLPEGEYELEVRAPERDPVVVSGVVVTASQDAAVTVPPLSGLGALEILLVEKAKGPDPGIPGKLVIRGRDGTPDPQLGLDLLAFQLEPPDPATRVPTETHGGSTAQGRTAYVGPGTATLRLRPGKYEVFGSRGPEYSATRKKVVVKEGRTKRVKLALKRQLETPNAISGDFHIHSARSLDTQAGVQSRVPAFAGEGVEVMVSTDHDFVLDYAPVIDALDLEAFVTSIAGVEVTGTVPNPPAWPNSTGHINAWPMTVDPDARRDGAIEDEFVSPNWIFSRLRDRGVEVIQYNHPRAGVSGLTSIGIFNNIGCGRCANDVDQACAVDGDCPAAPDPQDCTCVGYQPDRPLTSPPNDELLDDDVTGLSGVANPDGFRNIDFDVIEIGNGISPGGYVQMRADWFSLLDQVGMAVPGGPVPFLPGTGVSDSHRNTVEAPGYFRSYVLGVGEDPAALDASAFDAAVAGGRMMPTTGPYIELSVSDGTSAAGAGETLVPQGGGALTLALRVQAASWVPVDEVRVVVNGVAQPALTFDAQTDPKVKPRPKNPWSAGGRRAVERFDEELSLPLPAEDFYLLVEAGAKLDPLPQADPDASILVPDYVALAFTNPVFVDVDGDGFEAPGVAPEKAALALAPLRTPAGRARVDEDRAEELRAHPAVHHLRIPLDAARDALAR